MVISPDKQYMIIGSANNHRFSEFGHQIGNNKPPNTSLYLVNLADKTQYLHIDTKHTDTINAILFHSKQPWFFTAGNDGQIIQWQLNEMSQPTKKNSWWVNDVLADEDKENKNTDNDIHALVLVPDGKALLYATMSGHLYARQFDDMDKEQSIYIVSHAVNDLVVQQNKLYIALSNGHIAVQNWQTKDKVVIQLSAHIQSVESLALSDDKTKLASSGLDGGIIIWDIQKTMPEVIALYDVGIFLLYPIRSL